MTNCNEINIEAERLKSIFGKCYNLKALDLRDVVDLIESVNACSNGKFELKTINGKSLFGSGNIIVTADVDGTETKIQQGSGILISGSGSIGSPYVITSKVDPADGSETKIKQGSNISIGGTGTNSDPYVINAIMPSSEAQVNPDWSAISGPAKILNKPEIPLAQVNADWNAVSGVTRILNKPNTLNTNLGYVQSEFGGEITSSNGTSATIPLVSDEFPGLVSKEMLDALGNDLNNIKLEFEISMPTNETNEGFATSINTREFIEITGNQIPTFKAIKIDGEDSKIFYVEILGRGKGGYGVDGYQLSSEEVRFTSFNLTGGNIEDLPGTQIIDLGINSTDVVSVINSRIPNLIIQGQEDGYVLIKGTFNGTVYREYLWIGEGGIYGGEIGASQASYSNLKELTIESVGRATSTSSGTVKTNLTVEDPVVYLKETSDLLLNEKEDKANKQNSLTVDGTGIKYPTVDSVVGGLATKANISGQIFTGAISATNISGTNTGDETTLSIQTKRPLKTLDGVSIEGVGDIIIPTKAHALTHELGGTDVIQGENLSVNVIPPTNNYYPVTSTLKGHLQGIDQALGSVQSTLVSGTTIKTIEGQSILGSGNIDLTKTDVGLSNVDNTSDANKPISTATQTELDGKQSVLEFTPENVANKVTSIGASPTNTNYPSELAVKTYADNLVVGMLNDRGSWDASVNVFPAAGGSGTSGAIRKGDMWYVSVAGVLGGKAVNIGDSFRALVNSPAQVSGSWSVLEANVGYVPANDANVVHLTGNETIAGIKTFNETPIINKLVTVTNKGQYYDLLKNGAGSTRVVDQVNVWNGNSYVSSNNGIFSGYGAGTNNTGVNIGSISGHGAGTNNTGVNIGSISGYVAGQYNTGVNIGSISGYVAGQYNTGNSIGSISGYVAGQYNTGNSIGSISGDLAGQYNTGNSIGSISGHYAGRYNEGSNNIIGHNSHSSFLDNVSGTKTVSSIDIATERITITAHGFGTNSSYVNLRYTTTGTAIGGLSNNNIYQVQIIDANTIFFRVNNLTSEGTGTHTFTPQFKLNNVNVLGNSVNPTASNQTIIGNSSSTQFIAYGKHLVNTTIDNGIDQLQVNGTISATPATLSNQVVIKSQLDLKADLSSPSFTGTPTAPTAAAGTNTTQIATTAFVAGGLATKENTFSKNTAFNKNFGTIAGTVAEGNDSRILNGQTAFGWGNHANAGYALSNGSNLQSYTPSDWVSKSIPQVINASHSFTNGNLELSGHLYRSDNNYGSEHYDHYFGKGTAIAGSANSFANLRVRATDGGIKALRFGGDGSFSWDEANVLHALNFNSYSPTLTGTGATGTWGINISGNAASATSAPNYLPLSGGTLSGNVTASPATTDAQVPTLGQVKGITDLKVDLTSTQNVSGVKNFDGGIYTKNLDVGTAGITMFDGIYTVNLSKNSLSGNRAIKLPNASGTIALDSDLSGKFDKTGGTISGNVNVTGTVTASGGFFNSDRRLKNIFKRDGDVAYYTWKDGRDDKEHIGVIAQEVKKEHPDMVKKGDDGYLSVNYIEVLVFKTQELTKRLDAQQKEIKFLKSKLKKNGVRVSAHKRR